MQAFHAHGLSPVPRLVQSQATTATVSSQNRLLRVSGTHDFIIRHGIRTQTSPRDSFPDTESARQDVPKLPKGISKLHGRVMNTIRDKRLLKPGQNLLVAVSGGQDSLCLAQVLLDISLLNDWRLRIAHCNHRWRDDSDRNAEHVAWLADRWGLPCDIVSAPDPPPGTEASARDWRYSALSQLAVQAGCEVVVTGHTATDRAETLVMNLVRGAGADGMQALSWSRTLSSGVLLVRPLLGVPRHDTLDLCKAYMLPVWEDSTNRNNRFRRNRVRNELLPYLRQHFNPRADEALARTAEVLQDEVQLLEQLAAELLAEAQSHARGTAAPSALGPQEDPAAAPAGRAAFADWRTLREAPVALQRRAVRQLLQQVEPGAAASHSDVQEVVQLLEAAEALGGRKDSRTGSLCRGIQACIEGSLLAVVSHEEGSSPPCMRGCATTKTLRKVFFMQRACHQGRLQYACMATPSGNTGGARQGASDMHGAAASIGKISRLEYKEGDFVELGFITAAHGVRGEVKVDITTDSPKKRFGRAGTKLYLRPPMTKGISAAVQGKSINQLTEVTTSAHKVQALEGGKTAYILKLQEVKDRDQAELLRYHTIVLPANQREELKNPDEFYAQDLVGCFVFTQDDGKYVGRVVDLLSGFGTHDTLSINMRPTTEDLDKGRIRTCMIPFVKQIVPLVDKARKRILISPPEGLLDLWSTKKARVLDPDAQAQRLQEAEEREQEEQARRKEDNFAPPPVAQQQQQQEKEEEDDIADDEEDTDEDEDEEATRQQASAPPIQGKGPRSRQLRLGPRGRASQRSRPSDASVSTD